MPSADFEVAFITPVLTFAAQRNPSREGERTTAAAPAAPSLEPARLLTDFGTWTEYVAEIPPVLLVRVTPKLVEGFWTRVARGAARVNGVSVPPVPRFKAGFSRMRAFCGAEEVNPIHPFTIEHPVPERDAIREGLYVFDPAALGPHCGRVTLQLYSDKAPEKGDTLEVDSRVLEQIQQDFAPYRTPASDAPRAGR
jgi:hypothetical protein